MLSIFPRDSYLSYLIFRQFFLYDTMAFVKEGSPSLTSYVTLNGSLNPFKALVSIGTENWIAVRIN